MLSHNFLPVYYVVSGNIENIINHTKQSAAYISELTSRGNLFSFYFGYSYNILAICQALVTRFMHRLSFHIFLSELLRWTFLPFPAQIFIKHPRSAGHYTQIWGFDYERVQSKMSGDHTILRGYT